jgi:cytochrome b6-f complex iron-sulfur subunit
MKVLSVVLALVAAASTAAFAPARMAGARSVVSTKMAATGELYIDDQRRRTMNLIVVGSAAVTVGGFVGIPYIAFFVPPGSGGGSGETFAKDALGIEIFAKKYLETHPALDRNLVQGLKGDAT